MEKTKTVRTTLTFRANCGNPSESKLSNAAKRRRSLSFGLVSSGWLTGREVGYERRTRAG